MFKESAGLFQLSLLQWLGIHRQMNHPCSCTQTARLVAHLCRLLQWRHTTCSSTTWQWSMKRRCSLASLCLPTWNNFSIFHRSYQQFLMWTDGWIIVRICEKIVQENVCVACESPQLVCETKPQFTRTLMQAWLRCAHHFIPSSSPATRTFTDVFSGNWTYHWIKKKIHCFWKPSHKWTSQTLPLQSPHSLNNHEQLHKYFHIHKNITDELPRQRSGPWKRRNINTWSSAEQICWETTCLILVAISVGWVIKCSPKMWPFVKEWCYSLCTGYLFFLHLPRALVYEPVHISACTLVLRMPLNEFS